MLGYPAYVVASASFAAAGVGAIAWGLNNPWALGNNNSQSLPEFGPMWSKGKGLGPVNDPELQGTPEQLEARLKELRSKRRTKEENKLAEKFKRRLKELGNRNNGKERGGPCK